MILVCLINFLLFGPAPLRALPLQTDASQEKQYPNISELDCSAPVADNSRVYLTCSDGRLYAVDAMTGKKVWTSSRRSDKLSAPVIANGVLYFIGDDGKVHAVK